MLLTMLLVRSITKPLSSVTARDRDAKARASLPSIAKTAMTR